MWRGMPIAELHVMGNAQSVVCFWVTDDTSAWNQVSIATGCLCDLLPRIWKQGGCRRCINNWCGKRLCENCKWHTPEARDGKRLEGASCQVCSCKHRQVSALNKNRFSYLFRQQYMLQSLMITFKSGLAKLFHQISPESKSESVLEFFTALLLITLLTDLGPLLCEEHCCNVQCVVETGHLIKWKYHQAILWMFLVESVRITLSGTSTVFMYILVSFST